MTPADLYPALFGPSGRWPLGDGASADMPDALAETRERVDDQVAAMVARMTGDAHG